MNRGSSSCSIRPVGKSLTVAPLRRTKSSLSLFPVEQILPGRQGASPALGHSADPHRGHLRPFCHGCATPERMERSMDALSLIRDALAPLPGKRILDLGCGPGTLAKRLAEDGAAVTGIDPGEAALARARAAVPAAQFKA